MNKARQQANFYSGGLHLALLIFAIFGLPDLFSRFEEPEAIEVVLSDDIPILHKNNAPNIESPPPPKKEAPVKKTPTPTAAPTPPPKPVEKVVIPDKTKPPEPKKEEKKPDKPEVNELDSVLKDLAEDAREAPVTPPQKAIKSTAQYDNTQPMSRDEVSAIVKQIGDNWNVLAGAQDDYKLIVHMRVQLREDGTVISATLTPEDAAKANPSSNPTFWAAANRAMMAVRKSSPIKNLPVNKYGTWKDLEITFDPSKMLY